MTALCSSRFARLSKRVDVIKSRYLANEPDENGDYSSEALDDCSAAILLVHAELESYFEEVSRAVARYAVEEAVGGRYTEQFVSLLYYYGARSGNGDIAKDGRYSLPDMAKAAQGLHARQVKGCNGIKEKDLKKLFDPFAFGHFEPEGNLAGNLDAFGAHRGEVAHRSSLGVNKLDNPADVASEIEQLLSEIRTFEDEYPVKGAFDRSSAIDVSTETPQPSD